MPQMHITIAFFKRYNHSTNPQQHNIGYQLRTWQTSLHVMSMQPNQPQRNMRRIGHLTVSPVHTIKIPCILLAMSVTRSPDLYLRMSRKVRNHARRLGHSGSRNKSSLATVGLGIVLPAILLCHLAFTHHKKANNYAFHFRM